MKNKKARASQSAPPSRSEFDFIDQLRKQTLDHRSSAGTSLQLGIGDDAAVFEQHNGRDTVITTDLLVEEIDFRLNTTTPGLLGHKALAVSLSDIAAMGALPRYSMLSIGVPQEVWKSNFVDEFYEGYLSLARSHRVELIGGDVSQTPERVVIDSIVLGDLGRRTAISRSGAQPGDHIFVTGSLGGAAAGLQLLEHGACLSTSARRSKSVRAADSLLLRQLCPQPRVEWGLALNKARLATAMIDISDGLSSDLSHLCRESNVGARLDAKKIPIDPSLIDVHQRIAFDPVELALNGGEDFELLFTIPPRNLKRLPPHLGDVPVTYIGDITEDAGRISLIDGPTVRDLAPRGFSHFSG
ncbi:MAG: thiamine-monophosphate kinase [Acidobacteriota bacterium]|jgi:thiamine-monophosphate kinase|nr:thiamine-monophosphate kinase [Acidobacteriota bacterium]